MPVSDLQVDRDGAVMEDDESSSESGSDAEADADAMDTSQDNAGAAQRPAEPAPKAGPILDEDGFELVQRRKPRGRGSQTNR